MDRFAPTLALLGGLFLASPGFALSLDEYLDQVRKNNLSYQGSEDQEFAATLSGREADLLTSPSLFATAQNTYEAKRQVVSALQYDHIEMQNYTFGVMQQFEFGAQGKLYYAVDRTGYVGSNLAAMGSGGSAYDARPVVELSLPLWQNFGGRSTKATADLLRAQHEVQRHGANAQSSALLVQAEAAYWRLVLAREVVAIQEKALKQAEAIHDYVKGRANKSLGEASDVLQANALVASRRFERQRARNEEFAALHAFNTLRNGSFAEKVDGLQKIELSALQEVTVPNKRPGDRPETRVAKAQAALATANATLQDDKYRPKLELFGTYALNGQDPEGAEAVSRSFSSDETTSVIGLRLSVPLNGDATSSARRGAVLAGSAAQKQYDQKAYQQDGEWQDLARRMEEAKESLSLAEAIEAAQEAKLKNERQRLRQGRTTTYQILMFEQEYSQAELAQIRAAAEILTLMPQIKLYSASVAEENQI